MFNFRKAPLCNNHAIICSSDLCLLNFPDEADILSCDLYALTIAPTFFSLWNVFYIKFGASIIYISPIYSVPHLSIKYLFCEDQLDESDMDFDFKFSLVGEQTLHTSDIHWKSWVVFRGHWRFWRWGTFLVSSGDLAFGVEPQVWIPALPLICDFRTCCFTSLNLFLNINLW